MSKKTEADAKRQGAIILNPKGPKIGFGSRHPFPRRTRVKGPIK